MDFSKLELDEETRQFWDEVRAFLDEHLTEEVHEQEWRTGDGYNVEFWKKLGEKGWVMPHWSPEEGGIGANQLQMAILNKELRGRHAPMITNGTTSLVVGAVRQWATDEVKAEVLPGVAKATVRFCLGYTEPDAGSDLASARTRAIRDGDEWIVNGQKMFTTGAQNCQYAFLVARTNPDAAKHKGITMFLMPLEVPGVEITAIHTLGGERTNFVFFDNVRISDKYRLGPVDQGWMVLNGPLSAEHGMGTGGEPLETGGMGFSHMLARILGKVEDWARQPGPDGRIPLQDPTVRQRLARVALDIEVSDLAPGPMGRIVSSELLIQDAADLLDLVGPLGLLTRDEDEAVGEGWIEYAHRYAQGTATYGGTTDVHRNIIAEHYLGLPRSRPSNNAKAPVG